MPNVKKKSKILYYINSYLMRYKPFEDYRRKINALESKLSPDELDKVNDRVAYYNKLSVEDYPFETRNIIRDLKNPVSPRTYFHDTYEYARFFDENSGANFLFGDVVHVPELPSIVKSRPIQGNNKNAVLLNLDKARHFVWVEDKKSFKSKKNILIGRGAVFQQHRHLFFEKYFKHALCDLGQVNKVGGNPTWIKPKISLEQHLDYKFILCLQGNDVATNLKWVMSSNSIAVMPKPTIETWFMEGKLVGGKHFIEIKPDYSDVELQLRYYIDHPEACLNIIENAHSFCSQFFNKNIEDLCSLKVLERYFGYF